MEKAAYALVVVAMAAAIAVATGYSIDKQTKVDCEELQKQAQSGLVGFYITPSERDECASVNIQVNAPVKP